MAASSLPHRPGALIQVGVFGFFLFVYLLSSSRAVPWSDGKLIWSVAEAIVERHEVSIPEGYPGREGRMYNVHPLIPSLVHVPGAYLAKWVKDHRRKPATHTLMKAFGSHLGPSATGALTCLVLFRFLAWLRLRPVVVSLGTLAFGLGTIVWVYARYPYSEICQVAGFTGFFAALLRTAIEPSRKHGVWAGVWAGVLINTKLIYALSLPGALLWIAWRMRDQRRPLVEVLVASAVGLLPGALMAVIYNQVRWGSGTNVGYAVGAATAPTIFGERLYVGLWGLLLSPSKSLFLYSPALLIGLMALLALRDPQRRLWRDVWLALAVTAAPIVYVTAKLPFWSGDLAWGPRYMVFVTGALIVPACLVVDRAWQHRRLVTLVAAGAIALSGVGVQAIGNALYWDSFIRVSQRARLDWLGAPNRAGSPFPNRGSACDPCFEDTYPFLWLPAFNPLEINVWLIKHVLRGDDWPTAEVDAPWKRYTSLRLNVAEPYRRAHLDWWYPPTRDNLPRTARWMLVLFVCGTLGSAGLWGWRLRKTVQGRPE